MMSIVLLKHFLIGNGKQMHKITGIVTLSSAENYGAVLQCHSLCCFLEKKYCHTEIINFVPHFVIGRYPLYCIKTDSPLIFIKSIIRSILEFPAKLTKKSKFMFFRKQISCYSKKKYIGKISVDSYDKYIVGSDQVFNLQLTQFEDEFFLPRIKDNSKKIAYAASLGVSKIGSKEKSILKKGLLGFDFISIRELTGCNLIKSLLPDKNICQLCDPVFLNDINFWKSLASSRLYKKEYILIYTFSSQDLAYDLARKISKDVDIVVINDSCTKKKADLHYARGIGPKDFLSLILYSSLVITDSFHGTAFSIIFNKNFYTIPFKGTESRFLDMLSKFELTDRVVNDLNTILIIVLLIKK